MRGLVLFRFCWIRQDALFSCCWFLLAALCSWPYLAHTPLQGSLRSLLRAHLIVLVSFSAYLVLFVVRFFLTYCWVSSFYLLSRRIRTLYCALVGLPGWHMRCSRFPDATLETCVPGMYTKCCGPGVYVRRLSSDFICLDFLADVCMNGFSYDIYVYRFWLALVFDPWGILPLQSDWSLSCVVPRT